MKGKLPLAQSEIRERNARWTSSPRTGRAGQAAREAAQGLNVGIGCALTLIFALALAGLGFAMFGPLGALLAGGGVLAFDGLYQLTKIASRR